MVSGIQFNCRPRQTFTSFLQNIFCEFLKTYVPEILFASVLKIFQQNKSTKKTALRKWSTNMFPQKCTSVSHPLKKIKFSSSAFMKKETFCQTNQRVLLKVKLDIEFTEVSRQEKRLIVVNAVTFIQIFKRLEK